MRRSQEFGQSGKIPVYMCFVGPQKVYDSVDQELWIVLGWFGVPKKILTRISQSFECKLTCVWVEMSTRNSVTSHRSCGMDQ